MSKRTLNVSQIPEIGVTSCILDACGEDSSQAFFSAMIFGADQDMQDALDRLKKDGRYDVTIGPKAGKTLSKISISTRAAGPQSFQLEANPSAGSKPGEDNWDLQITAEEPVLARLTVDIGQHEDPGFQVSIDGKMMPADQAFGQSVRLGANEPGLPHASKLLASAVRNRSHAKTAKERHKGTSSTSTTTAAGAAANS